MTMHTSGWIEISAAKWYDPASDAGTDSDLEWRAVVDVGPLITWYFVDQGTPEFWEKLNAILHEGLPPDVSDRVRQEYAADEGDRHLGVFAPQWATFAELQPRLDRAEPDGDWARVVQIMEILAGKCGAKYVRLVLWTWVHV